MGKKKYDPWAVFREMTSNEQRENILNTASMCIDGAPIALARKIEIYLGATDEEQAKRRYAIHRRLDEQE